MVSLTETKREHLPEQISSPPCLGGDGSIPGKSRGNDQQNELATKKGKLAQEGGSLQNGTT